MGNSYVKVREFLNKYPFTIAWRVRRHCAIIDRYLNPGEKILYAFAGQKNDGSTEIFNTYAIAFTNKRIMVGTKRVFFGYFFKSITYDMYNDLTVNKAMIFGRVVIDTVKEMVTITNIDPRALSDIETNITEIIVRYRKEVVEEEKRKKKEKESIKEKEENEKDNDK